MKNKKIIYILMIVCILVAAGCGFYLVKYYYESAQSEKIFEELRYMVTETEEMKEDVMDSEAYVQPNIYVTIGGIDVQKKYEKIYKENNDFVGWLRIEDTLIDYPVMHTPDDSENGEYYIHRDFNRKDSAAGTLFMDAYSTINPFTDNVIIYGHNMNSGTMFHDLLNYQNQEFYENHKTFTFDTIYGDGTYEVIAAFYSQILPDNSAEFKYYEFVNAADEEEFMEYVYNIKEMSVIDTDTKVEYGDVLLTLSTCAYHVEDGRFAVVAKKIN